MPGLHRSDRQDLMIRRFHWPATGAAFPPVEASVSEPPQVYYLATKLTQQY
jgi:hypothetical protein